MLTVCIFVSFLLPSFPWLVHKKLGSCPQSSADLVADSRPQLPLVASLSEAALWDGESAPPQFSSWSFLQQVSDINSCNRPQAICKDGDTRYSFTISLLTVFKGWFHPQWYSKLHWTRCWATQIVWSLPCLEGRMIRPQPKLLSEAMHYYFMLTPRTWKKKVNYLSEHSSS